VCIPNVPHNGNDRCCKPWDYGEAPLVLMMLAVV
jgi:hypothetical protein